MNTSHLYVSATILSGILLWSSVGMADTLSVDEGEDWCAIANGAMPGDEIVLAPGEYTRPCVLRMSGSPDAPITIRSQDPDMPARIAYTGNSSNVIDITDGASHIVLRHLFFDGSAKNVDAIKIKDGAFVRIEHNTFERIGGVSVSTVVKDTQHVQIVDNVFRDLGTTCIYIGCQDGTSCVSSDVLIERNLISNVDSSNVGYGLQIKLNSSGIVRDNSIFNTKGPGIMIYGSDRDTPTTTIVEGNWVMGSRTDAAINLSGGPVIARRNIVGGASAAGIYAQNYQNRDLQKNVWIVHNTILPGSAAGISLQSWESADAGNILANNAIFAAPGQNSVSPANAQAQLMMANVTCDEACVAGLIMNPYVLIPAQGGALHHAGVALDPMWGADADFRGLPPVDAPDVGAIERQDESDEDLSLTLDTPRPERGDIPVSPQPDMGSTDTDMGDAVDMGAVAPVEPDMSDPSDDMGSTTQDMPGDTSSQDDEGCGCASSPSPRPGSMLLLGVLGLLGVWRRRWRVSQQLITDVVDCDAPQSGKTGEGAQNALL